MKKLFCFLSVFISCLIIYFTFDFFQYKKECFLYSGPDLNNISQITKYKSFFTDNIGYTLSHLKNFAKDNCFFRDDISNTNSNKKASVIVFGCSFAYGTMLKDNQTFSYKLSKLTKRNVYNKGLQACGIQHMFYILSNENFYKDFSPSFPPEYVIYIYIPSHLQRLTTNIFPGSLSINGKPLIYDLKGNNLEIEKDTSVFYKSFIIKKVIQKFDEHRNRNTLENNYKKFILANELFLQSKKKLEKHYPNIKFVILKYNIEEDKEMDSYEMPFMWDVLKKEGFIIINSKDLIGREFKYDSEDTEKDGVHPSEAAWDLLVPPLVKKLNL